MGEWSNFFEATKEAEPSKQLIEAIKYVKPHGSALDLGCGSGRDTRFMASTGMNVTAVDGDASAKSYIDETNGLVEFVASDISSFELKQYDLINSMFVLSFLNPEKFRKLFPRLVESLNPNGILNINIFGKNDEWNTPGNTKTFLSRADLEPYLSKLEIIKFEEIEKMGEKAVGEPKYWHVFNIISRKTTS